jgi:hypothetical protein
MSLQDCTDNRAQDMTVRLRRYPYSPDVCIIAYVAVEARNYSSMLSYLAESVQSVKHIFYIYFLQTVCAQEGGAGAVRE